MNSFSKVHAKCCMWLLAFTLTLSAGTISAQSYNDISLSVAASQTSAAIGDHVIFTIQVFNEGKTSVTGLVVFDMLPVGMAYLSHSTPAGTSYDPLLGMWNVGNALTSNTAVLQLEIEAAITGEGLIYNTAEVWAMNEYDVDSAPGNHFLLEDDQSSAAVSVPVKICTSMNQSVTLKAPQGYSNYSWFRDSGSGPVLVGNGIELLATLPGKYTFSAISNACPLGMSCPVIIEECLVVNEPPLANYDTASTPPNTPVIVNILTNDSDLEGNLNNASVSVTQPPVHGTVLVNTDGSVIYIPSLDFSGPDTFVYQICDNGIPAPVLCDTALVVVTVGDLIFDLSLTKVLAPGQSSAVNIGDKIHYLISVTNEGNFNATNIEISDHIPPGLALWPGSNNWTLDGQGNATITLAGPLLPGQTETVEIVMYVLYGASGQSIVNIAEVTGVQDGNGNPVTDVDSTPANNANNEDDQSEQPIELIPHDPTGFIYCEKTGKIITGGTITVTGPGQVFIISDGSSGYYEFFTDGTPGIYTLSYSHPAGYPMSTMCLPQPGPLDPTGLPNPYILGANSNGMALDDYSCDANPYYLTFDIETGDPFVNNNNIPIRCSFIGSIVCLDESGSGQTTGSGPGIQDITVNLYDCSDTLNPIMTTLTDISGNYAFDGLVAGNYMVQFVLPDGYRFVQNNMVSDDGYSDCITLDFGECDTTTSVCFYICPNVNAGQDVTICKGESAQLQAQVPYGTGAFTWSPAAGLSAANIPDPIATPTQTTTYVVNYDDGLGCLSADTITVTVNTGCAADYFTEDTVIINTNCDVSDPLLCFNVPYNELSNFQFELDGNPYAAEFGPCSLVRDRYYTYVSVLGFGTAGPYRLEYWSVNGVVFSGNFQNIDELVGLMNQWDANGQWTHNEQTRTFAGGDPHSFYGKMMIRHLTTGSVAVLDLYELYSIDRSYLIVPEGEHTLIISNVVSGQTDTVLLRVNCISPDFVEITQPVGGSDTICLNTDELQGNVTAVFNPCLDSLTNASDLQLIPGTNCVEAFGLFPGMTEACYVICDDKGICDTTYIKVTVFDGQINLQPDSLVTPKNQAVTGEILNNDNIPDPVVSVTIISDPQHGSVTLNADNTVTYVPEEGYCNDKPGQPLDQFTYQVCTATACESTQVFVLVKCDGLIVYNGFSPNGDGVNEFFKIDGLAAYPNHNIMVFNRWGNKVFEAKDYRNDWNGWWYDKKLPTGTYFYLIDLGDGSEWLSGYLQIVR